MNCVTEPLAVTPHADILYAYATIHMSPANPVDYVGGAPRWTPEQAEPATAAASGEDVANGLHSEALGGFVPGQEWDDLPGNLPQFLHVIELGTGDGDAFVPLVRFGLADDRRGLGRSKGEKGWFWNEDDVADRHKAHVCAWVSDGAIDYFGPFVRPKTPYDFKLHIDLEQRRLSAWVTGRGDGNWFLLVEDAPLPDAVSRIDRVRASVFPDGPAGDSPKVMIEPWQKGEALRPHPQAKTDCVVDSANGFTCQSMHSTWRQPGKHVTIFRKQGVHAGFPDVAQAEPGHLVCVWDNHSHTGGPGGGSLAHSHDGGRTWSEATQAPAPGRIQRLDDGALLLSAHLAPDGDRNAAPWKSIRWSSSDGGHTWSDEQRLRFDEAGAPGNIRPILCGKVLELSDGAWLLCGSSRMEVHPGHPAWGQEINRSTDRGRTWSFWSNPMDYPPRNLVEQTLLELEPGKLVVYARDMRADGMPGAEGFSEDNGRTWTFHDLPFAITGRTCAGFLQDGRVMVTFRSGIGRAALWAWIGDVNDTTEPQPMGSHFNDRHCVGLKDEALYIDNDGRCGQFTKYNLRPADTEHSTIDLTFEVMIQANAGRAASVSLPFAGLLRLFPDHVEMAHDPSLRADIKPDRFHTYRVISLLGRMELLINGEPAWNTDKGDGRLQDLGWARTSLYGLAFGNEELTRHDVFGYSGYAGSAKNTRPELYAACIAPEVTGRSLWRRFEAVNDDPDPKIGRRVMAWDAGLDNFPDQYQLDHIVEVEACVNGHENGYSGWVQLEDGRIFVVNYTDDTAAACKANPGMFGVPWIRGTFLDEGGLP